MTKKLQLLRTENTPTCFVNCLQPSYGKFSNKIGSHFNIHGSVHRSMNQ